MTITPTPEIIDTTTKVYVLAGVTVNRSKSDQLTKWALIPIGGAPYQFKGNALVGMLAQPTRGRWKWKFNRAYDQIMTSDEAAAPYTDRLRRSFGIEDSGNGTSFGQTVLVSGLVSITVAELNEIIAKSKPSHGSALAHAVYHMDKAAKDMLEAEAAAKLRPALI
jgi:hypothetical protein